MLCVLVPVGVGGQVSCFGRQFLLSFHDVTSMYFTHNTLLIFILVCHFIALYERCVFGKWWFSEVEPTPLRLAYEERRLFQNQNGPLFLVWKSDFHSDEVSRPWGCHFRVIAYEPRVQHLILRFSSLGGKTNSLIWPLFEWSPWRLESIYQPPTQSGHHSDSVNNVLCHLHVWNFWHWEILLSESGVPSGTVGCSQITKCLFLHLRSLYIVGSWTLYGDVPVNLILNQTFIQ